MKVSTRSSSRNIHECTRKSADMNSYPSMMRNNDSDSIYKLLLQSIQLEAETSRRHREQKLAALYSQDIPPLNQNLLASNLTKTESELFKVPQKMPAHDMRLTYAKPEDVSAYQETEEAFLSRLVDDRYSVFQ
jgi:hypothetical protein